MSQRIKRARERKQNLDGATMATGGHVVRHSRNADPVIRTPPQKATGNLPAEEPKLVGLAKASPFFKPEIAPVKPIGKDEEKKAIADAKLETEAKKGDEIN